MKQKVTVEEWVKRFRAIGLGDPTMRGLKGAEGDVVEFVYFLE